MKVAKGGDPVLEKHAARDVLTFGELAEEYIQHHAKPNKKSWAEDQRQLDSGLLPKWRNRPAVEVTAEELLAVLNAKLRDGAPVAANRLRALVSRIYTFGAGQRRVPATANPVIGVKKPTKGDNARSSADRRRNQAYLGCMRHAEPVRLRLVSTAARHGTTGR